VQSLAFGAIFARQPETLAFLIDNGLDVNKPAANRFAYLDHSVVISGDTLLMAACRTDERLAEWLVSKGADVHARSVANETAPHFAAASGYFGLAKLLVEKGADPFLADKSGNRAERHAENSRHKGLAEFLRQRTAAPAAARHGFPALNRP
jgi:ankyrin repeat protein